MSIPFFYPRECKVAWLRASFFTIIEANRQNGISKGSKEEAGMLKISILDAKTLGQDIDLAVFERFGEVTIHQTTTAEQVAERIKDQDIVIINKVMLEENNLKYANRLKLICIAATGTNNVDLAYAEKNNIAVTNVAGYSTDSVAQHTFAMLFYLLHKLSYYDNYVRSGEYVKNDIFTELTQPFGELKGKRWGIIGLGTIGKSVAHIAQAFGSEIVYFSTSGRNNDQVYHRLELEELLKTSDIISIHAPLNAKTKNLFTYEKMKLMSPDSILLNVGRGGIINEGDLARILNEGLIGGAALDVLEMEPIEEDNPLLKVKNKEKLLITPHIAWASVEARNRLIEEIILNIEAFLAGKERNRV